MEERKGIVLKNAMTYGLYMGLGLIVVHVGQYMFDVYKAPWWLSIINYAIIVGVIILGTINLRNKELGGYISYGKALGQGVLISLSASIIFGFYFGLLTGVIDKSYMDGMYNMIAETYLDAGMDYDQVEVMMETVKKVQSPALMTISQIFGTTVMGTVISLITSIFVKKEEPLFDNIQE